MRFTQNTHILKPKKYTILRETIDRLKVPESDKNAVFSMCYWFYREFVLDSDPRKSTSKSYPLHTGLWDEMFGSRHRKTTRDLILQNDRKPNQQPLIDLLYTNGSYVSTPEDGEKSRELEFRLQPEYFVGGWELTEISALYTPRKNNQKSKNTKTKFTKDQWGKRVQNRYIKLVERTSLNPDKVAYVMQRINPHTINDKVQILTCDALNYNNSPHYVSRSERVHRLYSKPSILKSELRYALEIDEEDTVILDVKSCSGYMMLPLLQDPQEKEKWITWLENGFYESFIRDTGYTRDNIKDGFTVWQGGEFSKGYSKYVNDTIKEEFPLFHQYFISQHKKNSKWLSYYCQRKDAKIIVDGIVLNPNIGFESISIHDALVVKISDKDKALEALNMAFEEHLGVTPKIKVEDPLEDYPEVPSYTPKTHVDHDDLAYQVQEAFLTELSSDESGEIDSLITDMNQEPTEKPSYMRLFDLID